MAKYRQVHTTFWDDGFVIDLTPEEKYFYLYLMTNNNTTQCGIYELPYRVIEMHTGYNRDTVLKLLERFKEYGKIDYNESTKEIILLNWGKYNFINSPKVKKCIEKEVQAVKHKPFIKQYLDSLKEHGYGIDTLSKVYGEEEEKEEEEKEEEEEEEEEEESASPLPPPSLVDQNYLAIKKHFEQHVIFEQATFSQNKQLGDLIDDYSDVQLITKAMDIAVERGVPRLPYINGILKGWCNDGITNYQQLLAKEAKSNGSSTGSNGKGNGRTPEEDAILSKLKNYNSADYR